MQAAQAALGGWSRTPVAERAGLLLRVAGMIRERQYTFCAWLTWEVGKNWAEADADVGETIDFLEFYAREALRLDRATTPIQLPGRAQRAAIPSAWGGGGDSAVELPACDYGRHDGRRHCDWQYGRAEAFTRRNQPLRHGLWICWKRRACLPAW